MLSETKEIGLTESEINKISVTVDKSIKNKGHIEIAYNQQKIKKVSKQLQEIVLSASNGLINIGEKYVAINASDLYHEYIRHSNSKVESDRGQIAITPDDIKYAIKSIFNPDYVEALFTSKNNPTQRQSFVYAKKDKEGYVIAVEVVGGNSNPNITPAMIIKFTKEKWESFIQSNNSLGEILYENDIAKKNSLDIVANKKYRVIAAKSILNKTTSNSAFSTVHTNNNTFNSDLSTENDKKYLEAVKNGDMATAQAMVEQAAREKEAEQAIQGLLRCVNSR
ncbi:MAG: hypothetical protein PUB34_02480 [Clostridia bacterium]|nr:hypothetical protein [Clostridia bacterium]